MAKEANQWPTLYTVKSKAPAFRKLVQLWDQLVVKSDVLWRIFENAEGGSSHPQLVVPKVLRKDILQELHNRAAGGYLCNDKVLSQLKRRYYWLDIGPMSRIGVQHVLNVQRER